MSEKQEPIEAEIVPDQKTIIENERKKALTFWLYGITDLDPYLKKITSSKALKRTLIKYFVADVKDIQHKVKFEKMSEENQVIADAKEAEALSKERELLDAVQQESSDESNSGEKSKVEQG